MSDCKICFHKNDGRVMQRPLAEGCEACNPTPVSPIEDACICPPLGEPRFLPVIAPVVFDECGINLCREITIPECILDDFPTTERVELKVLDIDFNIGHDCGSEVEFIARRPNCVRVKLARLCVLFVAKFFDDRCRLLGEKCFSAEYLPEEDDPAFDEETNPTSVTVELYAPYGVSYCHICNQCKPTISYLGFIEGPDRNNSLRQGIVSQALAKVIDQDLSLGVLAVGLSIYLKSVYFVQYKLNHAGLCIPPKCVPIEAAEDACRVFVEGNLLEQSIQPLEVCERPRTIPRDVIPVVDPTPTLAAEDETPRRSAFHCT